MRTIPWLVGCITSLFSTVNANVEKVVFLAPSPVIIPNAPSSLEDLRLDILSPTQKPILSTELSVEFPTAPTPHGVESWYLLQSLKEGRRYEVRICWPATQPTDFWLDTYTISQVFDTPHLLSSLASYSEIREELGLESTGYIRGPSPSTPNSLLFLRIQAAASFYTTNQTLMDDPPPVDVDIILDPFLLNIIPRSLAPTALYIAVVAVGAWFLSGAIYRWLLLISRESHKPHTD
ncbi:hypothetical protein GQ43DRAFT_434723 [Delitschia confertaspora ATCC 74209]|uniref:Uncharacterized protein n=1 Tax=Delitschia confertaspora ATCC 74209 TaxID=1513339 RepID=A0A9P4JET7_9PLEO|nr:hypothetical protein GQ43DRAFT_434723 [Delitschia confertaspora ATCC 74209]